MNTWFVVHAKPRQESVAQAQLERQGYRVYLPRLCRSRLSRSRWQQTIEPLFPRYLFVGLRVGCQPLGPVHSTRGVSSVLRFGDQFAVVPPALLDDIRSRANADGLHVLPDPELRAGDRLRIVAGPFAGFEGVYTCDSGAKRARILLEVLGAATPVTVPRMHLVAARQYA